MKKLSLKMLKEELSKNAILKDYEHIITKKRLSDNYNNYVIVYKMCLITIECSNMSIMGSCEGFITDVRMKYLLKLLETLEELL